MSAEHHFTEPVSIIAPHSYVIAFERGKPEIKPSHFGIGYSSLHQPTPEMAVEAYVRSGRRF
jgi:hypothetical protein